MSIEGPAFRRFQSAVPNRHGRFPGLFALANGLREQRRLSPYLALLDRYDVAWVELRTTSPGRVTYADDVQIVAVPLTYPEHWPFSTSAA